MNMIFSGNVDRFVKLLPKRFVTTADKPLQDMHAYETDTQLRHH